MTVLDCIFLAIFIFMTVVAYYAVYRGYKDGSGGRPNVRFWDPDD